MNYLQLNSELLQKYNRIINQQLEKGIIERMDNSTLDGVRSHYLSHHPVLTPSKITTKVPIVYDGSARDESSLNSLSLNKCLHQNPVILPELVGLLMRFRFISDSYFSKYREGVFAN